MSEYRPKKQPPVTGAFADLDRLADAPQLDAFQVLDERASGKWEAKFKQRKPHERCMWKTEWTIDSETGCEIQRGSCVHGCTASCNGPAKPKTSADTRVRDCTPDGVKLLRELGILPPKPQPANAAKQFLNPLQKADPKRFYAPVKRQSRQDTVKVPKRMADGTYTFE